MIDGENDMVSPVEKLSPELLRGLFEASIGDSEYSGYFVRTDEGIFVSISSSRDSDKNAPAWPSQIIEDERVSVLPYDAGEITIQTKKGDGEGADSSQNAPKPDELVVRFSGHMLERILRMHSVFPGEIPKFVREYTLSSALELLPAEKLGSNVRVIEDSDDSEDGHPSDQHAS